jgi:hypothetical protein
MSVHRVSRLDLPDTWSFCAVGEGCVYRSEAGQCDDPRTNKGNEDARCHTWSNVNLIGKLTRLPADTLTSDNQTER